MFGEAVVEQALSILLGNIYARLKIYVLCLAKLLSNRQLVFLWVISMLLFSLFLLFSNETHFMKWFSRKKTLHRSLNFTIRHIDDVLSLNNSKLVTMFNNALIKLSLKYIQVYSASCIDIYIFLYLEIDSEFQNISTTIENT